MIWANITCMQLTLSTVSKKKKTYTVDKTTYCGNKMGAKYVQYETVKRTCTIHSSLINPKLNKFT